EIREGGWRQGAPLSRHRGDVQGDARSVAARDRRANPRGFAEFFGLPRFAERSAQADEEGRRPRKPPSLPRWPRRRTEGIIPFRQRLSDRAEAASPVFLHHVLLFATTLRSARRPRFLRG